jgi:hypothetical protein
MLNLTAVQIAKALGSPLRNVEDNWPTLRQALIDRHIIYDSGIVAALATVGVECREFKPINEYGGKNYFTHMYDPTSSSPGRRDVAKELGNTEPGDGVTFHGRGYIQLTGRKNYMQQGHLLGIDLVNNPDLALDPINAAAIFARYFRDHGCDVWAQKAWTAEVKTGCACCQGDKKHRPSIVEQCCSECCWRMVRRKVNGGLNHLTEFEKARDALLRVV